jgi:hypothetical protein
MVVRRDHGVDPPLSYFFSNLLKKVSVGIACDVCRDVCWENCAAEETAAVQARNVAIRHTLRERLGEYAASLYDSPLSM